MLKAKTCKSCNLRPAFSKGLCNVCGNVSVIKTNSTPIKSAKKSIKPTTEKTAKNQMDKKEIRDVYFDYHIDRCKYSEESGVTIFPNKSNIAHLIDKGRHPSLQDNLQNYLYLTFQEHERFDKLLFSLEFDKLEKEFKNSWPLACARYINLLYLCHESTNFTRELKKYLNGRA